MFEIPSALAQTGQHIVVATGFVNKVKVAILYPLISLLFGIAFLYFLWGVFQMVAHATSEEARHDGEAAYALRYHWDGGDAVCRCIA
jgi:hypothetical protein